MSKLVKILIGIGVAIVIAGLWWSFYYTANAKEIELRNKAKAQIEVVEVIHDQMWKTISQKAQVSEKYKDSFDKIYTDIMEGRYSKGDGSLMKWIQEDNPKFSETIYLDLMVDIEALREKFADVQVKVEDLIREHKTLCQNPWYGLFIKNKEEIKYEVISSTRTKKVIETRKDDEINVFE